MTTNILTHELNTSDITVVSNITSMHMTGSKVSKLMAGETDGQETTAEIHLGFHVQQPQKLEHILGTTEDLAFILSEADALEIGLRLVEMGMKDKSDESIGALWKQLSQIIASD
jgi:hypothetical protein